MCAVSIAHGWAKVTDEPLAVAVHANIGLMHSVMAIYNAWCDRVPMFILGATGPMDAARRPSMGCTGRLRLSRLRSTVRDRWLPSWR